MSDLAQRIAGLSTEKRKELLARLKKKSAGVAQEPIPPRGRESNTFPLSFTQERLWLLEQLESGNPAYNFIFAMRLEGVLDLKALEETLNAMLKRHEILRTGFKTVNGEPVQVIEKEVTLKLPLFDLSKLYKDDEDVELTRHLSEIGQTAFDLSQAPLLQARLLKREDSVHVLLVCIHHIVTDGWSMGIFSRELTAIYDNLSNRQPGPENGSERLPELPIQYADFAAWQKEWLQGEVLENLLSYWKPQLANLPPNLELPTDRPYPAMQTFSGNVYTFELPKDLFHALQKMSQGDGASLFMTLLAALKALLFRYTRQEDIIVGSPIANRNRPEVEGLIGFFVNTLVLRTDLGGNPTFRELLLRVRKVAFDAYEHQDLPFEKLVEEIQPERNLSTTPFFQTMLILHKPQTEKGQTSQKLKFGETSPQGNRTAKYDLTLYGEQVGEDSFFATFEYNTDLFDATTIERMAGHFQRLLECVVEKPDMRLSGLEILSKEERRHLLVDCNATALDYPSEKCLHHLFEAQVDQTPESAAVIFEDTQLTYQELNMRANQLAHHLKLGILKAGGAYVPLDPTYPPERLAYMVEDADISILLSQKEVFADLLEDRESKIEDSDSPFSILHSQNKVICLDTDWPKIAKASESNPESQSTAANLAYVIYTSGSTGKPKGVAIQHQTLINFLISMAQRPGLNKDDTLLAVTTLSFDIAGLELYLPLVSGAKLILASREAASDARRLRALLTESSTTIMQATPATWRMLLDSGWKEGQDLKVLCGGEALPRELANRLIGSGASLWNMYGPTETTIWSAVCPIESEAGIVPVGQAIGNTQIYLLDGNFQPLPIGVYGELYIGGEGLARGYLNRPDLTSEKFIPDPFCSESGGRMYRTGDLARRLPDGTIEFSGRIDHQVKVRGFRIELGEIEAVCQQHPAIAEVVVMVREDVPGDKRLVAYLVCNETDQPSRRELHEFVRKELPDYMIPSFFILLDALPLTANNKINRNALPAPDSARPELEKNFVAPESALEKVIVDTITGVLKIDKVGIYDNFFELGGHSLLAMRIISQLHDSFQVELPLRNFFEEPSVSGIIKAMLQNTEQKARIERTAELLLKMSQLSDDEIKTMIEKKSALTEVNVEHE